MNARLARGTGVAVVDARRFAAVVFDMDGVLTDTARVHFAAWKLLFDDELANPRARPQRCDNLKLADYLRFVRVGPRPSIDLNYLGPHNTDTLPFTKPL